jgi:hypothetical protein
MEIEKIEKLDELKDQKDQTSGFALFLFSVPVHSLNSLLSQFANSSVAAKALL